MGTSQIQVDEKPIFDIVYSEKEKLVNDINEQIKRFHEKYPQVEIKEGYPFKLKCDFDLGKFSDKWTIDLKEP